MDVAIEVIRTGLSGVRVPSVHDSVFKEECSFCFHTAFHPHGLYVNLRTHAAYCKEHVMLDVKRTNQILYLVLRWRKVPAETDQDVSASVKPTKVAIGVEGGFQADAVMYDVEKENSVVAMQEDGSEVTVNLPNAELPELVLQAVETILNKTDQTLAEQAHAWEEEKRRPSRYAENLPFVAEGKTISPNPADWQCEQSGMKENLWLNLSTGYIGSGRRNWDGSGGTGAALDHYIATGRKYPLAVKLGTITAKGADVYSYADDENDMVEDPHLAEHLARLGINMMSMQQTEKTMAELTVELNESYEWGKITEEGSELMPVSGPGFVGMQNLGNSCYFNSLFQVLFSLPGFQERYGKDTAATFEHAPPVPPEDVLVQMAKLADGLLTERYADEEDGISPKQIKGLLGRGHPEFSRQQQQDVHEYYQHVLTRLTQADTQANQADRDISRLFTFKLETRTECLQSGKVRYTQEEDNTWSLSVPVEAATNLEEYLAYTSSTDSEAKKVLPHIPFERLVAHHFADEEISGYMSPATGQMGKAKLSKRFATFPEYLVTHLRRYVLASDWTAKKLDGSIPMPESLDLSSRRGSGLQAGEEEMKEAGEVVKVADAAIVASLTMMGFGDNASKRAALAVDNSDAEAAVNWMMAHMGDDDINDPLPASTAATGTKASPPVDEESLAMLMSMGLSQSHAKRGLEETGNDIERAAEWCFTNAEGSVPPPAVAEPVKSDDKVVDGCGKYELVGIISHLGRNTSSGHYVCHIKKNGKWTIFNDRKVALSAAPPLDLGYLYFYKRVQ